jgi:hypothetical protein
MSLLKMIPQDRLWADMKSIIAFQPPAQPEIHKL